MSFWCVVFVVCVVCVVCVMYFQYLVLTYNPQNQDQFLPSSDAGEQECLVCFS